MKSKLIEHILSILFVTVLLVAIMGLVQNGSNRDARESKQWMGQLGDLSFVDVGNSFEKALLKDAINIYQPGRAEANDSLWRAVTAAQEKALADKLQKANVEERLSFSRLIDILGLYLKFLCIYILVMLLTWYGVQTLAVYRFTTKHRMRQFCDLDMMHKFGRILRKVVSGAGVFLLFCPAYVIAYAIRTQFNTDTVVFLILLGIISNGVLITYANKFYAFLTAESRKGYIDNAVVKNLHCGYERTPQTGISFRAMFHPVKRFPGHVFNHIFANARFQYLGTLKEQASFIITGLIIIEMALNIHGYLNYEMLRQLLYRNYDIVVVIILLIFYTVKLTDIAADWMMHRESMKYENRV